MKKGMFRRPGVDVPHEVPRAGACSEALSRSLGAAVAEAGRLYVRNNYIAQRKGWSQPWVEIDEFLLKARLGSHLCSDYIEMVVDANYLGGFWLTPEVLEAVYHSKKGIEVLKGGSDANND